MIVVWSKFEHWSIGSAAFQEKGGTIVQFNYKSGLVGTEVKMSGLSRQNRDGWQLRLSCIFLSLLVSLSARFNTKLQSQALLGR